MHSRAPGIDGASGPVAPGLSGPGLSGPVSPGERLVTLDFIRGVAVLGIVFANIVAFAQPHIAYGWPQGFGMEPGLLENGLWLAQFVLIDGKMRGLFTLLFGAGMALFAARAAARGAGTGLQLRRLGWLAAFGLVHFFLLFWGDILFLYAIAGLIALPFLALPERLLLRVGLLWYAAAAIYLAASFTGTLVLEQSAEAQLANPAHHAAIVEAQGRKLQEAEAERAAFTVGSYGEEISFVAKERAHLLGEYPAFALFETVPLILIGMALFRLGFFSGGCSPERMRRWGWAGVILGAGLSLPLGLWAMVQGFPYWLTRFVADFAAPLPHLAMVLGLAALLTLCAPRAVTGWLGARLAAAGRMAFTNYIATSLVMMLVFRHWAGGLWGGLGRAGLLPIALAGCALMLAWSKPWLEHFRYGPLEWLWRCLTYGRLFSLRK
ncbi:DUF418 domain-containing protein [Altererythrobacter sp. CC-YST694]|uniref:DUF418 domain-containing protein n=1 Tax=Altererythrobacter sp. CC-YST694 TaxID=2755038 RepID=UPI001D012FB8|nr:DUF418 domain-containing protein [Altererythrobacter sp. CC-YST694]MCB5426169.1 DUF418 domain-containing protein [Altererythrobacter sp. CC-YST694]